MEFDYLNQEFYNLVKSFEQGIDLLCSLLTFKNKRLTVQASLDIEIGSGVYISTENQNFSATKFKMMKLFH